MPKVRQLLFMQGQKCFFCDGPIPKGEESLEHLVPVSAGGPNKIENVVACCKTLNEMFGNISIKEKMRAVLKQNCQFTCPRHQMQTPPRPAAPAKPPAPKPAPRPPGLVLRPAQSLGLEWPDKPEP